jgi:hypothetical protein
MGVGGPLIVILASDRESKATIAGSYISGHRVFCPQNASNDYGY